MRKCKTCGQVLPKQELISFDRQKYDKLKIHYKRAVTLKLEEFEFEDAILQTGYAKYLVEYLETRFKREGM